MIYVETFQQRKQPWKSRGTSVVCYNGALCGISLHQLLLPGDNYRGRKLWLISIRCINWKNQSVFVTVLQSCLSRWVVEKVNCKSYWMERQKLGLVRRLLPANLGPNPAVSIPPLASLHDKAKEAAEADRIVSRASQAAKEFAKQQAQLGASMKALLNPRGKGKGTEVQKGTRKEQVKGYRSSSTNSTLEWPTEKERMVLRSTERGMVTKNW